MSEFGHIAIRGNGIFIDGWGVGPFTIKIGDKPFVYRFEDSDRFGPSLVDHKGDILENPCPSQHSKFWLAYNAWVAQGRRVAEDGETCIWTNSQKVL